jgi:hypothetical protein
MPAFWKRRKPSDRASVLANTIETAIVAAVKQSDPLCEKFLTVWIEPQAQKSSDDANWRVKGVQFGKADREKSEAALAVIVERMRKKYELKPEAGDDKSKP